MRDGDTEGMQHFDGEIEKLIRAGTIDLETGLAYATNPGNLALQLADLSEGAPSRMVTPSEGARREPELMIEG
jgi:twitching motility protein PilT